MSSRCVSHLDLSANNSENLHFTVCFYFLNLFLWNLFVILGNIKFSTSLTSIPHEVGHKWWLDDVSTGCATS